MVKLYSSRLHRSGCNRVSHLGPMLAMLTEKPNCLDCSRASTSCERVSRPRRAPQTVCADTVIWPRRLCLFHAGSSRTCELTTCKTKHSQFDITRKCLKALHILKDALTLIGNLQERELFGDGQALDRDSKLVGLVHPQV